MLSIKEAYLFFNQEKLSEGIGDIGTKNYYRELQDFLKRTGLKEEYPVDSITKEVVEKYVIALREANLALASINHNLVCVRVFIYWCMKNNYINEFKIKKIKGQEEKIKYYTKEQIEQMLKGPRDTFVDDRNYLMISFILGTGCRLLTLVNLRVEDIDFNSKTIIYRQLKNKKVSTVPLSPQLEKTILEFMKKWETNSEWLFCNVSGRQLTRNQVQHSLASYGRKIGVGRISPHHLSATVLAESSS